MEKIADFDTDPRHQFIRGVKSQYDKEITQRQDLLKTKYHGIALIDLAKSYLEKPIIQPSDYDPYAPDWAMVIRYVLCGYGYKDGVSKTEVANDAEAAVMRNSWALSSAYQIVRGNEILLKLEEIYSPGKGGYDLSGHLDALNGIKPPKELVDIAQNFSANLEFARLYSSKAWFAHPRFWATAGVIDPRTEIGDLGDLTRKLEFAIRRSASVKELVGLSQQIQLTLAANPCDDWEAIRKALYLSLSVTSNPESAGNTFLTRVAFKGAFLASFLEMVCRL